MSLTQWQMSWAKASDGVGIEGLVEYHLNVGSGPFHILHQTSHGSCGSHQSIEGILPGILPMYGTLPKIEGRTHILSPAQVLNFTKKGRTIWDERGTFLIDPGNLGGDFNPGSFIFLLINQSWYVCCADTTVAGLFIRQANPKPRAQPQKPHRKHYHQVQLPPGSSL